MLAAMALVAAACGGATETSIDLGGPTTETPATQSATTQVPTSETATTESSSTEPSATEAPATTQAPTRERPDGPDASDFELALGGPGGTFSLSEETRPVFMVFWAEW